MRQPSEPFATKSDLAYNKVREMILSGELAPGSILNQAGLAEAIGLSTTPLREALRRLKAEGLVELGAHRDGRISPLTAEEARDLLEVRRSLDPLAAGLAAERRTREDIRRLREAAEPLRPLPGDPSVEELVIHRRFHAAIYVASHNDLLIGMLDGLWDKADRYRRLALQPDRDAEARARKAAEHAGLLECIVAGDGDRAVALMREHIETSLGALAVRKLEHPEVPGALEASGT